MFHELPEYINSVELNQQEFKDKQEFFIHAERLTEENWILQAMSLGWKLDDFFPAYYQALKITGTKEVLMVIEHT